MGAGVSPKVIFLLGPTASGKTSLALRLADRFPVEIVSVDSALVYRDMNIGTAKPDTSILATYPHHLVNIISPEEAYSVARFCHDARLEIERISLRGKVPLLTGGTMLYARSLKYGISAMPPADAAIRADVEAAALRLGWAAMHTELQKIDPETAKKIKPNDSQRIQRALEVFRISGRPISALQRLAPNELPRMNTLMLGLLPSDRTRLHRLIAERFENMLRDGLVDELRGLQDKYALTANMPSMRCVGYRQSWDFIEGVIDAGRLHESGISATRQLAKRQMTWMRSMPELVLQDCFEPTLEVNTELLVAQFLGV